MVVTLRPAISDTCVWHENARLPSIWTMHAPQSPVPHPNFVPVSFSASRITQRSGVSRGAFDLNEWPLTAKVVGIFSSASIFAYESGKAIYAIK